MSNLNLSLTLVDVKLVKRQREGLKTKIKSYLRLGGWAGGGGHQGVKKKFFALRVLDDSDHV